MSNARKQTLPIRRLAIALILIATVAGCGRVERAPALPRRVVVFDFEVPADFEDRPFEIEGWWFGSRDLRRNALVGKNMADILSDELAGLAYARVYPREELRYYWRRRERELGREIEADAIDPAAVGRDLGVDYVLTGRIVEAYTSHHRTLHSWKSRVELSAELWDTTTGQRVWQGAYDEGKGFASQSRVLERIAADIVEKLDKQVFRPPL